MDSFWQIQSGGASDADAHVAEDEDQALTQERAEAILVDLASTYSKDVDIAAALGSFHHFFKRIDESPDSATQLPNLDAKYRTLIEQLPAVVFMAYLDRGIGEAYVNPRIEEMLGFSQAEWLEDPVRWYQQIHPEDQQRWSTEAADMFLTGRPLQSAYRVLARDGRGGWVQCEAKMVRRDDGRPGFIQ